MNWKDASSAPENIIFMTKIHDQESMLKRIGKLWFYPEEDMYVYYTPTHYRELTESEREQLRNKLSGKLERSNDRLSAIIRAI